MGDEKEELIYQLQAINGRLSNEARKLLNLIVHPDLIEYTKGYIHAMDFESRCQKFEAPWSCAKDAEANYKNIKHGWLGGAGVGFDESWCEPCRKRVMEG